MTTQLGLPTPGEMAEIFSKGRRCRNFLNFRVCNEGRRGARGRPGPWQPLFPLLRFWQRPGDFARIGTGNTGRLQPPIDQQFASLNPLVLAVAQAIEELVHPNFVVVGRDRRGFGHQMVFCRRRGGNPEHQRLVREERARRINRIVIGGRWGYQARGAGGQQLIQLGGR